jgi:hypothetical protein
MLVKFIKAGLLVAVIVQMTGCSSAGKYVPTNLNKEDSERVKKGELIRLQMVMPESPEEKLVLTPASFPNGVYVCAIADLSKPCLPKLSALVAKKLAEKQIVISTEQSKADATLYFETWFDSYSTHSSMVKNISSNPTAMGNQFAAKMEDSLVTGQLPDVHKHFRVAIDPFSLIAINSNDEQKFIYVALTAVEMKDAIDYPGMGENHVGASKNPWANGKTIPASRTLVGNYDGEIPTEKAVTPILNDGVDLLLERIGQAPKKQ